MVDLSLIQTDDLWLEICKRHEVAAMVTVKCDPEYLSEEQDHGTQVWLGSDPRVAAGLFMVGANKLVTGWPTIVPITVSGLESDDYHDTDPPFEELDDDEELAEVDDDWDDESDTPRGL